MSIRQLHDWNVTPPEAIRIQDTLRVRVRTDDEPRPPQLVAGADLSYGDGCARAAVVVLDYATLEIVEVATAGKTVAFPYVPGLFSFREIPGALAAWERLRCTPDLLLVDGQGLAHPRRFGLACHLGVVLDLPTIGCAKSRLLGVHDEPPPRAGSQSPLSDGDETIGAVVRTRSQAKPIFVSVGHRVSLAGAVRHVLQCTRGHRLPEPLRLAHQAAAGRIPAQRRPRRRRMAANS